MEHVTEQQLTRRQSTVWRALRAAAPQTIPVLAGYFVLGMGYGIYVQSLGLPVWMPMLMGTVVYGGSLEFVLASLLLSAFSPLSAFLMALMIQARHLFYGLAMLERYKGYGLRSFYMIFAMSDETFSITCSAEPPEGVDRGWFMFFITLLDQCYWVFSAGLGAVVGSVLPFSTEGVDFVMTAMFTVIFLNQWEKDRQHYSALIGLAAPLACLVFFGRRSDGPDHCGVHSRHHAHPFSALCGVLFQGSAAAGGGAVSGPGAARSYFWNADCLLPEKRHPLCGQPRHSGGHRPAGDGGPAQVEA